MRFFLFAFLVMSCVTPSSQCSVGGCASQSLEAKNTRDENHPSNQKRQESEEESVASRSSEDELRNSQRDDDGHLPVDQSSPNQSLSKFDPSQLSDGKIVLTISLAKNIEDSEVMAWREKAECDACANPVRLDFLKIGKDPSAEEIDWGKIFSEISQRYKNQLGLKILLYPGIQESFLSNFLTIYEKVPAIDRVIFLDPGAIEGLNGIVDIASAGSKISKAFKKVKTVPSLEVLALFTGRGFEKDRRRIMAGNSIFFYTEIGMSDRLGPTYLVDWFIRSRNGIKSPFSYGGITNAEIIEIRGISPAAWFQRVSGSLTEDQSDDVLKLMLP
jgi:hypothetical protein